MATTTIPWGDGSGDNIYLDYSASEGDQTVLVSSDPNAGAARTKDITFVSTVGNISRTLTVLQESGMDYVSITWNDVCITYDDTAIAYPYEEQYIVFVDSLVEQICATNWGDGTGIKPSQAAQVTNAQFNTRPFRNQSGVTSFDELQYFTGLTTIGEAAFANTSLVRATVPTNVASLSSKAFSPITTLERISFINDKSISFGNNIFENDSSLVRVEITNLDNWLRNTYSSLASNPTYLSHHLYLNGVEVTTVSFPNDVTTINNYCLIGCSSITSVTIPSTVTSIGVYAFYGCSGLTGAFTIPSGVTTIGNYAFHGCSGLTSLALPSGLTSIQNNTFRGCSGLTSMVIPDLVTSIDSQAFRDCTSLTFVEVGSSCTSIGTNAFYNVGTTTNKCTYILRPTTPPTLSNTNAFVAARINKFYVPNGTLSTYQTASNWSTYASYMAELDANGNIPT